jgi:hypothetical protein
MTSRYRVALAAACVALLGLVTPSALRADNLVNNGGFETGDLTGWTFTAAPGNEGGDTDFNVGGQGNNPNSGSFSANFGAYGNDYDTIAQTLSTTGGSSYTVSFWLANSYSSGSSRGIADFQALWNGTSLEDIVTTTSFGYTEFTFDVTGTGSDTLSFEGYNAPSWTNLDDVSVSTDESALTPEPSSFYLLGTGLAGLCGLIRRKLRA